jgi:trans-aconitate methyltransferase
MHQNGWQVKSIMLANKIFNLIPDPTQAGRSLGQVLPQAALEELHIATDIEKAVYQLLLQGEQKIREWAQEEGIDYSFETAQELFIHNRREEFRDNFLEDYSFQSPLDKQGKTKRTLPPLSEIPKE